MSVEIVNFWRKVIRDASFMVSEHGSCDRMCRYSESLDVLKVRCSATRWRRYLTRLKNRTVLVIVFRYFEIFRYILCSYFKWKYNYKYMQAVCGRSLRDVQTSDQWMFISKLFWRWRTVDFVRWLLLKNNKFWESDIFLFSGQILGKHPLS